MAMGINRNTPAYISHREAGCSRIAVELQEREARYIKEVMKIDDSRWAKKWLKVKKCIVSNFFLQQLSLFDAHTHGLLQLVLLIPGAPAN